MAKSSESPLVLLDACCLINLLAAGRIVEVLRLLPFRFATSHLIAEKEVLAFSREDRQANEEYEDLELLELSTEEEMGDFVRFAMEIDDGEASVCALAIAHGGRLATDDRKALRRSEWSIF